MESIAFPKVARKLSVLAEKVVDGMTIWTEQNQILTLAVMAVAILMMKFKNLWQFMPTAPFTLLRFGEQHLLCKLVIRGNVPCRQLTSDCESPRSTSSLTISTPRFLWKERDATPDADTLGWFLTSFANTHTFRRAGVLL